jgi:hypothetical protein
MTTDTKPRYYADPAIDAVRDRENLNLACGFISATLTPGDSLEAIADSFNTGHDDPARYHWDDLRGLI